MHPGTPYAPSRQSKSQLYDIFAVGEDLELQLDRLLKTTTKKGRQLFKEKIAPQTKSWLRLWRLRYRRKESSRSLSHLLASFL